VSGGGVTLAASPIPIARIVGDCVDVLCTPDGTLLGHRADDLIGRPVGELFHSEDDYARFSEALEAELRAGRTYHGDQCFRAATDETVRFEVHACLVDSSNWDAGMIWVLADVTERRAQEDRHVRAAEVCRLLESLAFSAGDAEAPARTMTESLRQVCEFAGWQVGHAALVERDGRHAIAATNYWYAEDRARVARIIEFSEGFRHNIDEGVFVSEAMRTKEIVMVSDLSQMSEFGRFKGLSGTGLVAGLAAPVLGHDGEVGGFVEFFDERPIKPDRELLTAIRRIGEQLGRLAERSAAQARVQRLNADLERRVAERTAELEASNRLLAERNREVGLTSEMVSLMQICDDIEASGPVASRYCRELFRESSGGLYLIHDSANIVELIAEWGGAPAAPVFGLEECWAIRRGQPHVAGRPPHDLFCRHADASAKAAACIPMMAAGHALGILHLSYETLLPEGADDPHPVRRDEAVALAVGEQLALALANLRLRETLRNQSVRDALTGLFNRRYLEETLEREIARARRLNAHLAILMVDVDHFKRFNDRYGHEAGDAALRALGRLFREVSRESDVVCRYGGEEFTIVLPDSQTEEARGWVARMMAEVQRLRLELRSGKSERIRVSVGLAEYPQHGETVEALLRAADGALYDAKEQGRDRMVVAG
jgi:diguanylate cyclase (GGDEF)-like protein